VADALEEHIELAGRIRELLPEVEAVAASLIRVYEAGGRLYTFGNGGSAADAQHLSGELLGRFKRERRPLPAMALSTDPSTVTCIANDYEFDALFERQLQALVQPGDMAIGYTTSGSSENVVRGLAAARGLGAVTVLFGGDGPAKAFADHALVVPSTSTARTQEMHLLLMHLLIDRVDAWAAGEPTS
jgi:D-sedoheptulose 7-phosphate isomerase